MTKFVARAFGRQAAHHARRKGWLDVRLGFSLLRSPHIPLMTKMLALGIGFGLTLMLVVLEIPLEVLVGAMLPFLGFGIDLAFDGLELAILPFVFGAIVVTHIAPKNRIPISVSSPRR